jgi:long-chain acyl-CoA synthetase
VKQHLEYPDIPFHGLLSMAAERWGDRPAIVFGDRTISFAAWDRGANRLAARLVEKGIAPGDRVALYLPNCPEYEIAFFAISRAGAIPTPLNPAYRDREVRYQMLDSGAVAAFVHVSLLDTFRLAQSDLPQLREVTVVGSGEDEHSLDTLMSGPDVEPPTIERSASDIAVLPYSSGTTGLSKGVMLTHRNLVSNALQWVHATRTTPEDTLLIFLPLYHIYGVGLIANALWGGARQVLMERFNMETMLRLVEDEHVTELYVVPPVMMALAAAPEVRAAQFSTLRFLMSAAAPLSPEVAKRVSQRLGKPVIQAYGLTETSPLTHMVALDRASDVLGTVGVVVPDTECRIVDLETGTQDLQNGEVGEVIIRGPQVMAGYWNAPDASAETLRNGWIYTGDIGSADVAGNLSIVDRKKEMIKYKAFSIAPAELESVLLEHPDIVDCGVTAQPDDEAGEVPRAYVVTRPGVALAPEEIVAFVRARVAGYKQVRTVELVDAIPRTPSGKILRRVLKERARAAI